MMITGVDWSGDGGWSTANAPDRGLLIFAFASIDSEKRDRLHDALDELRERYGFSPKTVFKHSDSSVRVRSDFLDSISDSGIEVRVRSIDKFRDWPPALKQLSSNQRITTSLASFIGELPAYLVDDGTLLLDLDQKKDGKLCTSTVGAINRATRDGSGRRFRKVKCCPDSDDEFGIIIQVADMVAGAVRRAGTTQPAMYPNWNRFVIPWNEKASR